MSISPEIAAARDDVQRSRAQIADTIAELEERVAAPVRAVKQRLDVVQLVREHPWPALALAASVGAAIAASRADARAATLSAQKAREGGTAALRMARENGTAALHAAKGAPSRTRVAVSAALGSVGAKLASTLIDALRDPGTAPQAAPVQRSGLGFIDNPAPAHAPV
jgi:hypothetical protein